MNSILFLCVHNACRSQISEAICRGLAPGWTVASAGSNPATDVDPKARLILEKHGLKISGKPKGFTDLPNQKWDLVVGMGCGDKCPMTLKAERFIEWQIKDPQGGPEEIYQALYDNLTQRIQNLLKAEC